MRVLLPLSLLFVAGQGLATALRNQVQSLVGQKLSNSTPIIREINKVDEDGRNALHHAIILGNLPLVDFFLVNSANTQAIDK